jgi:hypothetical protein
MTSSSSSSGLLAALFLLGACTHAVDGPRGGTAPGGGNISNGNSSSPPGVTPSKDTASSPPSGEIDPRFVPDMKQAFNEYKAWGRVDDEMRWAPFLCRMPMPGRPTMSAAEGDMGHAKKLYSLFARDHDAYVSLGNPPRSGEPSSTPTGLAQIVAKESFIPELVDNPGPSENPNAPPNAGGSPEGDHFHPYVKGEDGKTYRASKLAGVYFVIEKPGDVAGTDDGFIYGTVTPTGEVTSAGRVSSCMGCHVQAKHRRFFGSPGHI